MNNIIKFERGKQVVELEAWDDGMVTVEATYDGRDSIVIDLDTEEVQALCEFLKESIDNVYLPR